VQPKTQQALPNSASMAEKCYGIAETKLIYYFFGFLWTIGREKNWKVCGKSLTENLALITN
jgi:hypothetical protein